MSKYIRLLIVVIFTNGCVYQRQTAPTPNWQTRGEAVKAIIEMNIALSVYDSADVYQRGRLYYAARRNRGAYMYSPAEAREHLLDSVVFITTPTISYRWEFNKGLPNGSWVYLQRSDTTLYCIETYQDGQLLKREKFKNGPPPYFVETFQGGQLLKQEGTDSPPKK